MPVMFLRCGLFGLVLLAETALADAYRFSCPAPKRGLVLGRGRARLGVGGIRFGRRVVMLLMRMMRLMFSDTVILLSLPCLT